jgi:geranylgeranyl diphosphate synthase, type II
MTLASNSAAPVSCVTLAAMRRTVDARLRELVPAPHDPRDLIGAAMHEGVLAPGKRTRPLLMLLVGRALQYETRALLDIACAVEMTHSASLFLDDLPCMDNAWLRRGRPSIHARYGEDIATLSAVALLSQAWGILASVNGLSDGVRARLVVVMSEAVGAKGLVRGQYRDLHEGLAARELADITATNQQKTGVLFAAALEMAALAAGGSDTARASLQAAASELGQAFQMRDDLEDGESSDNSDGNGSGDRDSLPASKDRHKDDGKSTLVALLGREAVERRLQQHLLQAEQLLRTTFPGNDGVVGLMLEAFGLPPRTALSTLPPPRFSRQPAGGAGASLNVVR